MPQMWFQNIKHKRPAQPQRKPQGELIWLWQMWLYCKSKNWKRTQCTKGEARHTGLFQVSTNQDSQLFKSCESWFVIHWINDDCPILGLNVSVVISRQVLGIQCHYTELRHMGGGRTSSFTNFSSKVSPKRFQNSKYLLLFLNTLLYEFVLHD